MRNTPASDQVRISINEHRKLPTLSLALSPGACHAKTSEIVGQQERGLCGL